MDANPQTSFIPKRPLTDGVGKVHTTNFFSIIATVIFITVLALAGLVFGYQYYLQHLISQTQSDLQTELAKFPPELIAEWTRLDNRIESSKTLLGEHVDMGGFFTFLSNETLQNIRFTSFSYSVKTNSTALVVMSGQAKSFAAVASQAAEFTGSDSQKYFQNPLFSDLNLDSSGNVSFNLTGTVNTNAFLYSSLVAQENAASAPVTAITPTSDTSASNTSAVVDTTNAPDGSNDSANQSSSNQTP